MSAGRPATPKLCEGGCKSSRRFLIRGLPIAHLFGLPVYATASPHVVLFLEMETAVVAGVPAKPKPGEGWSPATARNRSRHGCLYRRS
jgi:hypothetical protein